MGFSWQRSTFSPIKRPPLLAAPANGGSGFWQRCRSRIDHMMNGWERPRMIDRS